MWYDKQEGVNYGYEMTFPLRKIPADSSPEEAPLCFLSLTPVAIPDSHADTASEPPLLSCLFCKFENLYWVWLTANELPSRISWKMSQLGAGTAWPKAKAAQGCHDVGYMVRDSEGLSCFQIWTVPAEWQDNGGKTSSGSHFQQIRCDIHEVDIIIGDMAWRAMPKEIQWDSISRWKQSNPCLGPLRSIQSVGPCPLRCSLLFNSSKQEFEAGFDVCSFQWLIRQMNYVTLYTANATFPWSAGPD